MRYKFDELFKEEPDGRLTPRKIIKLDSVTLSPSITFGKGVSFGGINIFNFKGSDIEVVDIGGTLVVKGFYEYK